MKWIVIILGILLLSGCSSLLMPYHSNFAVTSNGNHTGYGGSVDAIYKLTMHPKKYVPAPKQPKKQITGDTDDQNIQ